jgi:hypothetical protein
VGHLYGDHHRRILVDLDLRPRNEETMSKFKSAQILLKKNSPLILASAAVGGVLATSIFVARASFKAADTLQKAEPKPESFVDKAKLVWTHYIPAAGAGVLTTSAIFGSLKISSNRTAATAAAYSATAATFDLYRDKVKEALGPVKEKEIKDKVAEEKVAKNPPSQDIIVLGSDFLCCELHTGRYFTNDMQTLRKAQNDINALIMSEMQATLEDLYDMIGLEHTANSDEYGWTSDRMLEIEFSSVLTKDGRPCLTLDYNYLKPLYGYRCAGT